MKTHGQTAGPHKSGCYKSWISMITRCNNPKSNNFNRWGGRGIFVCQEWLDFSRFYKDMGERPEGKSLDRINNDGPYCKSNCRWASPIDQARNSRNNRIISFQGETLCLSAWAQKIRVKKSTLVMRLDYYGWSVERALTTPARKTL